MTELNKILDDLKKELISNIKAIVSRRPVDTRTRFLEFDPTPDNQDIRTYSAETRQFQIMAPVHIGDRIIGATTTFPEFTIDVVFAYPDTESWMEAAYDDMDQMVNYFRTRPSTTTGVAVRFVTPDSIIQNEKSPDDLRRYYIIQIFYQLEVTHS